MRGLEDSHSSIELLELHDAVRTVSRASCWPSVQRRARHGRRWCRRSTWPTRRAPRRRPAHRPARRASFGVPPFLFSARIGKEQKSPALESEIQRGELLSGWFVDQRQRETQVVERVPSEAFPRTRASSGLPLRRAWQRSAAHGRKHSGQRPRDEITPDRSDRGSSLCSRRPRSPSRTSGSSRPTRRPPRGRATASANRRSDRRACRST